MRALWDTWDAGGPLMVPLAILCLAIWYWLLCLGVRLRRERASALSLSGLFHGSRPRGTADEPPSWVRSCPGAVGRVAQYATAGEQTPTQIRQRLAEAKLVEISRFEHELGMLKAMVSAAPLLGLLGTVRGMIATFFVLSQRGASSMELLSAGISEALLTTQVGLIVALPGFVGAFVISRRIKGLALALDILESHLTAIDNGSATLTHGGTT